MNKKEQIDLFFNGNKLKTNGINNSSVDGTGILASVTDTIGQRIANFIYNTFNIADKKDETLILDVRKDI